MMSYFILRFTFFFFQAEDGIRDYKVTGVQTCALPISGVSPACVRNGRFRSRQARRLRSQVLRQIGRASCRERVEISVDDGWLKKKSVTRRTDDTCVTSIRCAITLSIQPLLDMTQQLVM